jgi:ketosteroid isomerase-like protein
MMKRVLAVTGLLAIALPAFAADVKSEIAAANQKWVAAFNKGDAAALTSLYTDKATVLPPGTDMVSGREAVLGLWDTMVKSGMKVTSLESVSVKSLGAGIVEIGRVKAQVPGPDKQMVPLEGKYVVIWKRIKGTLKLDTDIWNLNK